MSNFNKAGEPTARPGMRRIMQHCFGKAGTGGPVVALDRLISHSSMSYGQIRQQEPAGGINLSLIRRFIAEIRAYQPELIHVRGLGNEGFHAVVAARLAGVPNILLSIHGTHRDLEQPGNRFRHWIVVNVLERLSLMLATHLATVCEFAARRPFLAHYQHKLVGVVSNGVQVPDVLPACEDGFRARWGIPDGWLIGLCVSRITEEKGYVVLAEALARLDGVVKNLAVVIVGGGDEDGRIKARFEGLSTIKVVFVGHQASVEGFWAASDFFVFPSLHENLSNALLEAMAYRLPVIATNVGGNTEVIAKGGGVLVPAGDSEALAGAINRFLSDQGGLAQLGAEAQENVRRHYSVQQMVAGWEGVYARILGDNHDPA